MLLVHGIKDVENKDLFLQLVNHLLDDQPPGGGRRGWTAIITSGNCDKWNGKAFYDGWHPRLWNAFKGYADVAKLPADVRSTIQAAMDRSGHGKLATWWELRSTGPIPAQTCLGLVRWSACEVSSESPWYVTTARWAWAVDGAVAFSANVGEKVPGIPGGQPVPEPEPDPNPNSELRQPNLLTQPCSPLGNCVSLKPGERGPHVTEAKEELGWRSVIEVLQLGIDAQLKILNESGAVHDMTRRGGEGRLLLLAARDAFSPEPPEGASPVAAPGKEPVPSTAVDGPEEPPPVAPPEEPQGQEPLQWTGAPEALQVQDPGVSPEPPLAAAGSNEGAQGESSSVAVTGVSPHNRDEADYRDLSSKLAAYIGT